MKKLLLSLTATFLFSGFLFSATTLVDPATNGGFESGSDFAANGWTVVNGAANMLYVGNAPVVFAGSNCAFSGSNSTTWAGTATASVNHFYRSISFPAGESSITLKFRYKVVGPDATYDYLKIWLTSSTPLAGTQLTSTQIGGTYDAATSWTEVSITIPGSYAGTITNLVFSWRTDSAAPYAAVAIDNIELISKAPDPLHGVYSINNTLPTSNPMVHDGTGNFASFTDAISSLNGEGITAAVTFNVTSGQVFNEKPAAITASGTSVNPIVFQKNGAGANPKITPAGVLSSTPYDFGFCISGGDYITFDGIDVDASSATTTTNAIEYGYLIRNASATNGAQYNVIKNCTVTLNKNYIATGTSGCIFSSVSSTQGGVTPTNATGANSYNKFYNLTLQNAQNGLYLVGNSSYPDLACEIGVAGAGCQSARNTISNMGGVSTFTSAYGIYTSGLSGMKIFNNDISNIRSNQSTTAGILCATYLGTSEIYNNNVNDISNSGATSTTGRASGIEVQNSSGTPTIRVYNNFVSDIKSPFTGTATANVYAFGIYANNTSTATVAEIDNNSVHLFASGTPTYSAACFAIANSSTAVQRVRGNIFVNAFPAQGATARHTCWYSTSATAIGGTGSVSNYNDMYIKNDAGISGFVGRGNTTYYNTVANWATATTQDANSISIDPAFAGNTNLHASAAGLNAVAGFSTQAWVTSDIDCDDRGLTSPADLGADAFNLASCAMPTGLTSSNTTYISADISWTAPSTGTPSGYEWEVRTSGLGGSGATGLFASGSTTHPAVSASVTGLSGGSSYTLYVRTFCGGSDYSAWASNTFSTLSCSLPTGVVTSAVTASSANLTWVAPVSGSPEGYEWEVRSSGAAGSGATGLAASGSTTSPVVTASASGLTSATAYSVYVRTMCYSGFYSGWTTAVSFTTQCSAEPAPTVVQDFTTYTGTAPAPICWSEATGTLAASSTLTYGSSEWTSSAGFANAGTNKGVKVNLYSTGNDWIISQPIDLGSTAGLYRVKYRIAVTSYNGTVAQSTLGTHKVDVVISTDGGATWSNTNVIRTYTGAGSYSNTGQEETINLTSYSGVVKFAIVESTTLSSPDIDFHFDDFVVEELPSCVGPTSLSATNVTLSSATLNWMVYAPVLSEYEVRTSGLPGSGGEIASGSTGFGVSTANVTGLSSNTTYLFYVRSNCGVGSFSTWTGPYYFFTGYCTPAPTSVDGSGITRVVYSTVNNPTIAESGNYGNYTALVGNVGQGMTIPVDITFTTGYTYDTKIWIDWNDDLDFSDSGEEVYTGTSLAASPTTLNASFIVPLTATLGNHRMRIGGLDVGPPTPCYTGTYGSYEDYTVNVVLPPSCLPPSGLAASNFSSIGADLTWTSPDSFFDIFIETFGSPAPETGTTPTIDDNEGTSYTWKDGSPATAYQYFVRADCGQDNTDVSDWAGPFAFTTLCETISVFPYTETFSGGVVPPTCWSEIISNTSYNWKYNSTNGGFADVEYDPAPANQDEWLVSPEFDFSGLTHPRLTFDWLSSYYWFVDPYDNADFVCNISLDGGGTWTPIWDEEDEGVFTNYTWYTKRIDLTLYAGEPSVKFAYRYVGYDAAQSGIDNFKISEVLAATWTGATSSVWSLAGNWNPDVPGANTNVIIPGGLTNYPTLTAAASCNNFTIQSGGSFIGSEFLTVGGTTTIERSIGAYSAETASDGWHLVSSPVANQAISGAWTPATGYDFYALDESVAEYWLNQKNHAEMTSFIPGEGYLVAYEVAGTKTFSGALNTTAVTLSGLTNTPGDYAGSHLVGNPFTSAINSASFTGTNVAANVQVWNSTNAAYEVAATIPALNGFMVYTTGAGELTIPLAARTHTGPAWFKSGSEDMILLQANDTERNMAQKSIVRFNAQATEAFDMEFDAYYLAGFAPMFYSKSADEGFALNTLPVLTNETVIPFDFIKNESSEFNIEMVQAVPGAIIYLTDKKANKVVNLTESHTYHFTAVEGDLTDRFLLSFGAVGIDNPDASVVNIYAYHDKVFVNGAAPGSEVKITNLLGQEMIRTSVNGIELKTINAGNLANGVYVVSIISGNNVVSKKVVLEK